VSTTVSDEHARAFLAEGELELLGRIPWASNATLLARVRHQDLEGLGRYKTVTPGDTNDTFRTYAPEQFREIRPGPDGFRFVAIGGVPGAFQAGSWTELGADPPSPPAE